MSVFHPPVRPRRVEPYLLPLLRERFPDVSFGGVRSRDNPERECVMVAEPQQPATPVSQYVRLRISVWIRRGDGTGDYAAAQRLASLIATYLTGADLPYLVVSIGLDSGPIRLSDEDGVTCAYLVLLLTVSTV